jgi:hypothetical protein
MTTGGASMGVDLALRSFRGSGGVPWLPWWIAMELRMDKMVVKWWLDGDFTILQYTDI